MIASVITVVFLTVAATLALHGLFSILGRVEDDLNPKAVR